MALILLGALAVQATILRLMGQPLFCDCGVVRVWNGVIRSGENSQQLTDWYTFSHIIHGLLFYAGIRLFLPRLSLAKAFALALAIEVGWELFENSPPVIARYRLQALARGYSGDSVLNSCADVLACAIGFVAAAKLPVRVSVGAVVAMEVFTLVMVRDSLALNVIQFVFPIEAVGRWQDAATSRG
jgi:hypothetical protein